MLLLVKDTKFESKSQQVITKSFKFSYCFYWSKIQNLKANHNWRRVARVCWRLLLLVKDTKFESKSQQSKTMNKIESDCFYWSKIQNLKANHNLSDWILSLWFIAFTGQRYKIWKQITTASNTIVKGDHCFYWSKIQNLKANHNQKNFILRKSKIAFTGQRYKIWKQITTDKNFKLHRYALLLLVKDTKFESKSQHGEVKHHCRSDCFYWSKIQNLKANHNTLPLLTYLTRIAFTGQRYKIWKQITTEKNFKLHRYALLLLVKDTKFESKSQQLESGS